MYYVAYDTLFYRHTFFRRRGCSRSWSRGRFRSSNSDFFFVVNYIRYETHSVATALFKTTFAWLPAVEEVTVFLKHTSSLSIAII